MNLPINAYEFWHAPTDYNYNQYLNYRLVVCNKISSIRNLIEFLKRQIADPEVDDFFNSYFSYPSLKRAKESLKLFEQQASLLSA